MITFDQAMKKSPRLLMNGFDPLAHTTVRDLFHLAQHELDLYEEGEPTDIKTRKQFHAVQVFKTLCEEE